MQPIRTVKNVDDFDGFSDLTKAQQKELEAVFNAEAPKSTLKLEPGEEARAAAFKHLVGPLGVKLLKEILRYDAEQ